MTRARLCSFALICLAAACSSDPDGPDAQTPPTSGRADIEQWLEDASYRTWACEPAVHETRSPSPHGFNKICSNDLISSAATGTTAWPKGAAAVKELYASSTATTPTGFAVYLKTAADSADGANWYWYERIPTTSNVPNDPTGVIADGKGSAGAAKSVCVACHAAAGTDMLHTPSTGGRDQVYTPVP